MPCSLISPIPARIQESVDFALGATVLRLSVKGKMMEGRDERLARAVELRQVGKAEEAREILLALVGERPEDGEVLYQTAWTHDTLGLEREAVPYYRRALDAGLAGEDRRGALL